MKVLTVNVNHNGVPREARCWLFRIGSRWFNFTTWKGEA